MSEGDAARRLFVAITPPGHVLDHLGHAVDDLEVSRGPDAGTRLTAREGWHITLAFLGPVPHERVPDATAAVTRATQGWAAGRREPLTLGIEGSGTFGARDRRILWAGLGGDLVGLHALAEAIRGELAAAGLDTDSREFQPHLTITRPGAVLGEAAIADGVRRLADYVGLLWSVTTADLYASDAVAGTQSRYTRLASAPL